MKRYHSIVALILLLMFSACSSVSTQPRMSPSGRYDVRFVKGNFQDLDFPDPKDAFYSITDQWFPGRNYSISSEDDKKLKSDSIVWSPTEKVFVIRQSDFGMNRRFVLVVWNRYAKRFDIHVIFMRPIEQSYFDCHRAVIASVSEQSVVFKAAHFNATKEISLKELIAESLREDP